MCGLYNSNMKIVKENESLKLAKEFSGCKGKFKGAVSRKVKNFVVESF